MNFELEAKYINEFKTMLDKDERVIRHLVIKRDNAITKDCPPPPEFHTLRADMQGYDGDEDLDYDDAYDNEDFDEMWDGEGEEVDGYDEAEDGVVIVNIDNDNEKENNNKSTNASTIGRRNLKAEKVIR